jgi:hypothetical protein
MVRSAATSRVSNHQADRVPICDDFTMLGRYAFLREKNALNAATASVERMRSPNKWPS